MKKSKPKPLTEAELQRYERALRLWDISLQKQEQELDAREAELDSLVDDDGESIYEPANAETVDVYNNINWEAIGRPRPVICRKPTTFRDIEDGCKITPEEFATTLPACGMGCSAGVHRSDCPVKVYLEVERLAKLEDPRKRCSD
jgi:hypothetical protein